MCGYEEHRADVTMDSRYDTTRRMTELPDVRSDDAAVVPHSFFPPPPTARSGFCPPPPSAGAGPCITSSPFLTCSLSFFLSFSLLSTPLPPFYTHPKPVNRNHVHHFHWQRRQPGPCRGQVSVVTITPVRSLSHVEGTSYHLLSTRGLTRLSTIRALAADVVGKVRSISR